MKAKNSYNILLEQTRQANRETGMRLFVFIIPGTPQALGRLLLRAGVHEGLYEFLLNDDSLIPFNVNFKRLDVGLQRPIPLGEYPNLLLALAEAEFEFEGIDPAEFIAPLENFLNRLSDAA